MLGLWLAGAATFALQSGCGGQVGAGSAAESQSGDLGELSDAPLAAYRTELLNLAFGAASAMPLMPHIKNRSRAQEAVVTTCLELDQPQRALSCIEKIDNWRRGAGYADLAFYCAQRGLTGEAQELLGRARPIAEQPVPRSDNPNVVQIESDQEWRGARIRAKIARTYILLGQQDQAARLAEGIEASEKGPVEAAKAMLTDAGELDAQLADLDAIAAGGNLDQVRDALALCAVLFDRFYGDAQRRAQVEKKIRTFWGKVPLMVCIELMMELTGYALDHQDRAKALELVSETQQMLGTAKWLPEDLIRLSAQLAALRHRAGETAQARKEAGAALALYDAERSKIVNIFRGGALRPLAEAYHTLGDTPTALMLYKRAIEEGVENPNSRPRAEDLSATCCSMALNGVEPDAALRARLQQVFGNLSDPW